MMTYILWMKIQQLIYLRLLQGLRKHINSHWIIWCSKHQNCWEFGGIFRVWTKDGTFAGENVLTDISFKLEKGQTLAVIGSTGSGKSSLINLIPRFYDVTQGCVRVDGVDVREMSQKELRDCLGYVPQKGVLFSGTIDSNIRYGKTDISEMYSSWSP